MATELPDVSKNFLSEYAKKNMASDDKIDAELKKIKQHYKSPRIDKLVKNADDEIMKIRNADYSKEKLNKLIKQTKITMKYHSFTDKETVKFYNLDIMVYTDLIELLDIKEKIKLWENFINEQEKKIDQKPDEKIIDTLIKIWNYGLNRSLAAGEQIYKMFNAYLNMNDLDDDIKQKIKYALEEHIEPLSTDTIKYLPPSITGIKTITSTVAITGVTVGVGVSVVAIISVIAMVIIMTVVIIVLLFVGVVICLIWIIIGLVLIKRNHKPYTWRNIIIYGMLGPIAPYV